MNIRKIIITGAASAGLAAAGIGSLVLASAPGNASTVYTYKLTGLADTAYGGAQPYNSDGGPVWATDSGTVTFRVLSAYDNDGTWSYQGIWEIHGVWLTLPGAAEPNEPYAPYSSQLGGALTGELDVSFTSTKPVQNGGTIDAASVPGAETTDQASPSVPYPAGLAWLTNAQMLAPLFPASAVLSDENTTGYDFTYTDAYGDILTENQFINAGQGGNLPGLGKITSASQEVTLTAARRDGREYLRACVTSATRVSMTRVPDPGRRVFFRDGRGLRSVTLVTGANGCTATRELSGPMSKAVMFRAVATAGALYGQASSGWFTRA